MPINGGEQCETRLDHARWRNRSERVREGRRRGEEKERTKRVSRTSEPRESSCGTDGHFRTIVEKSRDYPVFGGVAVARPQSFAHPPRLRSTTGTWNAEYYASATLTLRLVERSPKLQGCPANSKNWRFQGDKGYFRSVFFYFILIFLLVLASLLVRLLKKSDESRERVRRIDTHLWRRRRELWSIRTRFRARKIICIGIYEKVDLT